MHKPHYATQGQSTKMRMGVTNVKGGGAPGQKTGGQNKACKPQYGAQGQKKAGGASKGGGPKKGLY